MANFKFTGTITVYDVRSKNEAINQLQIMLDDYENMNPDNKEIIIHWDKVEKVTEGRDWVPILAFFIKNTYLCLVETIYIKIS